MQSNNPWVPNLVSTEQTRDQHSVELMNEKGLMPLFLYLKYTIFVLTIFQTHLLVKEGKDE